MEIKLKGIYKHFKGNFYIVEDVAISSENLEKMVVYRALYGNNELWVRPLKHFFEEVNENGQKYRFELQQIDDKL